MSSNNKSELKQTYFDSLVTNRNLQLIKAVIPYVGKRQGGMIGIIAKMNELQNSIKYAGRPEISKSLMISEAGDMEKPPDIFDAVKDFLDPEMTETLEMITSLMSTMNENPETKDAIFNDYMDIFKNIT